VDAKEVQSYLVKWDGRSSATGYKCLYSRQNREPSQRLGSPEVGSYGELAHQHCYVDSRDT
jgi:hypothetical protein